MMLVPPERDWRCRQTACAASLSLRRVPDLFPAVERERLRRDERRSIFQHDQLVHLELNLPGIAGIRLEAAGGCHRERWQRPIWILCLSLLHRLVMSVNVRLGRVIDIDGQRVRLVYRMPHQIIRAELLPPDVEELIELEG